MRRKACCAASMPRNNIDSDRLAFVEAHGTGTPVGDPIEATALGRSIGRNRSKPLPIGSIKTNIGHLEPASGLAGVLKAMLALNHGILPPSLHFNEPNPHIDFDAPQSAASARSRCCCRSRREQYAGVNSFGFGGTNAHAVVAAGRKAAQPIADHGGPRGRHVRGFGEQQRGVGGAGATVRRARLAAVTIRKPRRWRARSCIAASASQTASSSRRPKREDVASALNAFISGADDPQPHAGHRGRRRNAGGIRLFRQWQPVGRHGPVGLSATMRSSARVSIRPTAISSRSAAGR